MASMGPSGVKHRVDKKKKELKQWRKKNNSTRKKLVTLGVVRSKKMNFKSVEIKRNKNETQVKYLARKEKHIKHLISEEREKARRGKRLLQTTRDLNSLDKKISGKGKRKSSKRKSSKRKSKGGFFSFNFFKKGCDKYQTSERMADKKNCKKDKNCYYEVRGSAGTFCYKKPNKSKKIIKKKKGTRKRK
jgi:hypothetical protein